jgi:hypothetical protein
MAIAFDTATDGGNVVGTATFAHTCSGSDRFLVVAGGFFGTGTGTATYNGVSMTQVVSGNMYTNTGNLVMFFLANPASGSHNVVVTPTNSGDNTVFCASSYTGAIQSSSNADATATNTGDSGSATVSVTTSADNCWVIGSWRNSGTTSTAGSGTTIEVVNASGASSSMGICDNNTAKTPAGSVTLTVGTNTSNKWGMVGASFAPASAGGGAATPVSTLALLGCG